MVFDNADFNTINGKKTFYSMGGITCITLTSSVQTNKTVKRLKTVLSAKDTSEISFILLKPYQKFNELGFKIIKIENVFFDNPILAKIHVSNSNFLRFFCKCKRPNETPGWNGTIEVSSEKKEFKLSKIVLVPLIKAPSSDRNLIVTALMKAEKKESFLDKSTSLLLST